jgi:hypothetical protein
MLVGRTHIDHDTGEMFDVDNQEWELDVEGQRFGPYPSQQHCSSAFRNMRDGISDTQSVRVFCNGVFTFTIQ